MGISGWEQANIATIKFPVRHTLTVCPIPSTDYTMCKGFEAPN